MSQYDTLNLLLPAAALGVAFPLLMWSLAGIGRRKPKAPGLEAEARRLVDEHQIRLQQPVRQRFFRPVLRSLARRARRLTPAGWVTSLERQVRLAGSPAAWPVERVLAVKLLLAIATLVVGLVWVTRLSLPSSSLALTIGRIALVPVLAVGAYVLPDLLLRARGHERQQAIQTMLPDALDQMSISVEAGLGFDSALQRVAESGGGALPEELSHTLRDISIGIPRKQAFRNLVERTDVSELRHFVFAVNQAEEYGLPIAQVLRVQSKELRVIRRQRAEERALKIPVKIVLPLVLCIFPALFVVVLVPAVIRILEVLFN